MAINVLPIGNPDPFNVCTNSVFPKLYSCPSGIYRNEEKINFGISDKSSPVAGAAIEKQIDIDKFYYFNDIQRA